MHSARLTRGPLLAVAIGMSASCGSHRLSGGPGTDSTMTFPPLAGDAGSTGGTDATGTPVDSAGGVPNDGGLDGWTVQPATLLPISPREALTRVARVLWEAAPDQSLLEMADSGTVTTDADVRAIAIMMLGDPRSRVGVGHFYRWWLGLDALQSVTKDADLFPEYSSAVGTMMAQETETFGVYVTLDGDGQFSTLMRASYSFINETLAPFYGATGVTGADLRKVDLNPSQRAGILTQLANLTLNSGYDGWTAPSTRGTVVENSVLCLGIPREPAGTLPLHPDSRYTNRELIGQAASQPACAACHVYIDPVGFAYEGFDSIGRARLTDAGKTIDDSGDVRLASGEVGFNGPVDLARILSEAPEAHRCVSSKWLEYMLGRTLNSDDMASVIAIDGRFEGSNLELRTAVAAAASSASFLGLGGGPPCTPGADQSCNSNPALSSLHGACGPDGKCVCAAPFTLDGSTGKCL